MWDVLKGLSNYRGKEINVLPVVTAQKSCEKSAPKLWTNLGAQGGILSHQFHGFSEQGERYRADFRINNMYFWDFGAGHETLKDLYCCRYPFFYLFLSRHAFSLFYNHPAANGLSLISRTQNENNPIS